MRDKVYSYRKVTEREKECIQRYIVEVMKPVRFGRVRILVNNLDNAQEDSVENRLFQPKRQEIY